MKKHYKTRSLQYIINYKINVSFGLWQGWLKLEKLKWLEIKIKFTGVSLENCWLENLKYFLVMSIIVWLVGAWVSIVYIIKCHCNSYMLK